MPTVHKCTTCPMFTKSAIAHMGYCEFYPPVPAGVAQATVRCLIPQTMSCGQHPARRAEYEEIVAFAKLVSKERFEIPANFQELVVPQPKG